MRGTVLVNRWSKADAEPPKTTFVCDKRENSMACEDEFDANCLVRWAR